MLKCALDLGVEVHSDNGHIQRFSFDDNKHEAITDILVALYAPTGHSLSPFDLMAGVIIS